MKHQRPRKIKSGITRFMREVADLWTQASAYFWNTADLLLSLHAMWCDASIPGKRQVIFEIEELVSDMYRITVAVRGAVYTYVFTCENQRWYVSY